MIKESERFYGWYRAGEMLNVKKIFPEATPVKGEMVIATELSDLGLVQDSAVSMRITAPIGSICPHGIERASLDNRDLSDFMLRAKAENPESGLLLFSTKEHSSRDERLAGISILAIQGEQLIVEAVGRGFDGREVSKGLSCHERYCIPWQDLYFIDGYKKLKKFRTYLVEPKEYSASRSDRVEFLAKHGINGHNVPIEYKEISDSVWDNIIDNIFYPILIKATYLKERGFSTIHISGHTEGVENPIFRMWSMASSR